MEPFKNLFKQIILSIASLLFFGMSLAILNFARDSELILGELYPRIIHIAEIFFIACLFNIAARFMAFLWAIKAYFKTNDS